MPAMRIIPSFNVGGDSQAGFLVRTERPAIDQFAFQGGEEALAQCVIITVASSPLYTLQGKDKYFLTRTTQTRRL